MKPPDCVSLSYGVICPSPNDHQGGSAALNFLHPSKCIRLFPGIFQNKSFLFQFSKSIDLPSLGSITLPLFNKEDYDNLAFGFYLQNIVLKCLKVNNTNCIFPVTKKEEVSSS